MARGSQLTSSSYMSAISKLARLSSTWSGTDKMFMVLQYSSGLTALLLTKNARLLTNPRITSLIASLQTLQGKFSETRMAMRLFGSFAIIQWYANLNKIKNPSSRYIHFLEKVQALSLLGYYPLEHLYWLGAKGVITSLKPAQLTKVIGWSCRFWFLYTVAKLMELVEERRLMGIQQRRLLSEKGSSAVGSEEAVTLMVQDKITRNSLIVNGAYFPLTIHWSTSSSFLPDEILTQSFGLLAGIWQIKGQWQAAGATGA